MDEKRSQLVEYPQSDVNVPHSSKSGFIGNTAEEQARAHMHAQTVPLSAHGRAKSQTGQTAQPDLAPETAPIRTDSVGKVESKPRSQQPVQHQMANRQSSKRFMLLAGLGALIVVLGVLGTVLYSRFAVQNVTAFQVSSRQRVAQFIGGGGLVTARQQISLSSPLPTRVAKVLVNAGDTVKANQPLLKLDQTTLDAQVKMAQDNVAAAESYLYSVSNAFPYNPVTVAGAQQALREARSRYQAMQTQASTGNMIAPFAGVVTMLQVLPGESYRANTPFLTVADPSVMIIHAKVPVSNLGKVTAGMDAQVTPPARSDLKVPGKVVSVVPQADAQTDTFEVQVQVNNTNQVLLPGMSAFVSIQGQTTAYVLPRLAVLNPDRESSVFVIRNGHAVMQEVHVVGRDANSIFVDSGVAADDTLVLLPLDKVHDGQSLKVTETRH